MDVVVALFGQGRMLGPGQMVLRAIVVFAIALVLIRIAGRRVRPAFAVRLRGRDPARRDPDRAVGRVAVRRDGGRVVRDRAAASRDRLGLRALAPARTIAGRRGREVYRNGRFDDAQMRAALITPTDVHESACVGARRGRPVGRRRGDPGRPPRQHRAAQPLPKAVTAACGDGCRKGHR